VIVVVKFVLSFLFKKKCFVYGYFRHVFRAFMFVACQLLLNIHDPFSVVN